MFGGFFYFMFQVAIIADGGFIRKKLKQKLSRHPTTDDIEQHCLNLLNDQRFKNDFLFRVFYYDCPPLDREINHPVTGKKSQLHQSTTASYIKSLIDQLKLKENFAVRLGTLVIHGWKLGEMAQKNFSSKIKDGQLILSHSDFVPNISQKGVDMKIGLDIALLATKRLVNKVILITGDSDFIPAMKLARREGIKVYLDTMEHSVFVSLKEHADGLIS